MHRAHGLLAFSFLALAGCANLNTVHRQSLLGDGGVAIHLDAPQRVTISNSKGWACSEPSPDALQAYASSLGLGFGAPSKESVSVAQALSASAGSIGLRTQSITLMRDALFRICELYFNGAITQEAAIQLLQRSQDLTLGVLAIEQLTGAVVAQQVRLTTSSAASAAATINDTQRELDRARADEADKKKALEAADKALEGQNKAVVEKKAAADAAKQKAVATQKVIDDLAPKLAKAKQDQAEAEAARTGAEIKVKAMDIVIATPRAEKAKLEGEVKPLRAKTEAAKKAHDDAEKAGTTGDELAKLKKAWDDAAAAEKPTADKLKVATEKVTALDARLKEATDALATARSDEAKANDALAPLQAQMDVAKKDPNQVAADAAAAELKAATEDQAKKKATAEAAKTAYEEAQETTLAVAKLGRSAVTNAAANTSGSGEFSTSTSRYGLSKDTVDALTRSTVRIVELVMTKGHMTDTCGVLLMTKAEKLDPTLSALCATVILEALQIWKEDAKRKIACETGKDCGITVFAPFTAAETPGFDSTGYTPFANAGKTRAKRSGD